MNNLTMTKPADYILDVRGLFCPEPVMMLHNKIRDVDCGDTIEVIATDPATQRDIPKFCAFLGHELMHSEERDNQFHYVLKKNGELE